MLDTVGAAHAFERSALPARPLPKLGAGPLDGQLLEFIGVRSDKAARILTEWRDLVEESGERPITDQLRAAFEPSSAPSTTDARRWSQRVLGNGSCVELPALRGLLRNAMSNEAADASPIRLLTGELRVAFDELETLRATVAAVAPHLEEDESLAKAVAPAKRVLEDSALQGSRDAASDLTSRIRKACQESSAVDDSVVARRVERKLVEGRSYSRRNVFGEKWVRCSLVREGASVTCYLPESIASTMPLYANFPVRVIGEIHPRQDHDEESSVALTVVALGRLIEKGDD